MTTLSYWKGEAMETYDLVDWLRRFSKCQTHYDEYKRVLVSGEMWKIIQAKAAEAADRIEQLERRSQ